MRNLSDDTTKEKRLGRFGTVAPARPKVIDRLVSRYKNDLTSIGMGGLLVNIAAAWVLHSSSQHSMNVEGAFQHVLADLLGSVGVVISAILILAFEWTLADPILSVVIAVLILFSSRHLMTTVFKCCSKERRRT